MPKRKSNQQAELIALALRGIDARIAELERKRTELLGQTGARTPAGTASTAEASTPAVKPRRRRRFSAAHRAKLRAAAQRRWGKKPGEQKQAAVKRSQTSAKKAAPTSEPTQKRKRS